MPDYSDSRWMNAEKTADYISVRPDSLPRLVRQGRIPTPSYRLGPRQPRWDKLELDTHFQGGAASTDPEQVMANLAQSILAGR